MLLNQYVTKFTKVILYTFVIGLIGLSMNTLYTKSACVIVHGTWASSSGWYQPGGQFFEAVVSTAQELQLVDEVVSFTWSGKLGYPSQCQAAQELADLINQYDSVILIGHSHGVTVGMICCDIIFESDSDCNKTHKIDRFYALGVPIDERVVCPNMDVIKKFYNLFSFGDLVQTVNGSCERVFTVRDNIVNISVQFAGIHPSHNELHHPAIGKDLLKIDEYLAQKDLGNFKKFDFCQPGVICFDEYKLPKYDFQLDQDRLLLTDKDAHRLMTLALFRGKIKP